MTPKILQDISALIEREGSRSYLSPSHAGGFAQEGGLYQACLCGLTATFGPEGLLRLQAYNLDMVVQPAPHFFKGTEWTVTAWHSNLMSYLSSVRTVKDMAA